MNKRNSYKGFAVSLLFVLSACTSGFDNVRPYEPTDEDLQGDNFRAGAFYAQLQQNVISTHTNQFQLSQNLVGDIYAGYMAGTNNWFSNKNNSTYFYQEAWLNNPFEKVYAKAFGAWMEIKRITGGEENSHAFQLAQILKVASLHRFTDMWGPIPYSMVGTGELTTAYDCQKEVYHLFFVELEKAVEVLGEFTLNNPGSRPLADYDLVYNGDYLKWMKFANSLKLRLAMRLSYVEPELAKQKAEEAVKHPAGLIEINDNNAVVKTSNGIKIDNPLYTIWSSYNDIRMGASMFSFMTGYEDPRLEKFFAKGLINEKADYYALRNGVSVVSQSDYKDFSSPNILSDTPLEWLTASEVAFLKAEGALRGWAMGTDAKQAYENGIRLSFAKCGATRADEYIVDNKSVPVKYSNPKFSNQTINAMTTITIAWNAKTNFEEQLERIITQKWIAIYPNGQEAWSEFRRTGYPKLFPVMTNNSGGTIDTRIQVRRLPFPKCEYTTNEENVKKAIALLGGPDTGGTKLWWDKK